MAEKLLWTIILFHIAVSLTKPISYQLASQSKAGNSDLQVMVQCLVPLMKSSVHTCHNAEGKKIGLDLLMSSNICITQMLVVKLFKRVSPTIVP